MALYDRVPLALWFRLSAPLVVAIAGGCAADSSNDVSGPSLAGADGSSSGSLAPFGDASACRPGAVDTYQPDPYHPAAAAWRGVCVIGGPSGSGQDRAFFDACLAPDATPEQCSAFRSTKANDDCANCIQTADAASHYGPLINNRGTFITANVAGCIELTDPAASACAKALQAWTGCELWACQANCPVHDQGSRAAYDQCAMQTDRMGCGQYYEMAAACSNAEADAGPSAKCLQPTFSDFYYAVVPLFCGVRGTDAGAVVDASADAVLEGSSGGTSDARTAAFDGAPADVSVDAHPASVDARAEASVDGWVEASVDGQADASIDARVADASVDATTD